ncbi:hypothetical protein BC826DRAFT_1104964 [Russula brevipes]|nr:hypothetical protein BC826DRAFT_1104964 [Russula brevipes]
MISSVKLALFAFLCGRQSKSSNLSRKLRAFILRGLLLLPHILLKLKKIWSWYSQPRSGDGKKMMGNAGSLAAGSAGISWGPEDHGIIYASRAVERVSQPSSVYSTSRFGGPEESIPLAAVTEQSHGPSFATAPPSPDFPRHPAHPLPTGDTASSSQAETTTRVPIMSNPPITWAHPRTTSSKFTGVSSRTGPRAPSPSPSASPPALPAAPLSPSSFCRYFFRPNTPERLDIEIAISSPMTQDSQHPLKVSADSSPGVSVQIQPPSRSGSPDSSQAMSSAPRPRPSSLHRQTQGLSTQPPFPSPEFVRQSAESSHLGGHGPPVHGEHITSRHLSTESSQGGSPAPLPTQGSPEPSIPFPVPTISGQILGADASATQLGSRKDSFKLEKMTPDDVSRYKKKGDVEREDRNFWLTAMDLDLSKLLQCKQGSDDRAPVTHRDSGGWFPVTHPGGALYFYHETFRAFTDVYMYDPDLRAQVHEYIDQLGKQLAKLNPNWGPPMNRYDLVLDIIETKDKKKIPHYYYVDHDKGSLFWLEDHDLSDVLHEVPGVQEPDHIRHRLEAFYWEHWSLYPHGYPGRNFPADAFDELLGVLLSNSIDSLTSNVSTAIYSVADMEKMRDFVKDAKDLGPENDHAICSLDYSPFVVRSRLDTRVTLIVYISVHWKFVHFHGQKISRQDRNKSIYAGDGHKRTKAFRVLSLILFFTPDVHLRELKKVWMDELVIEEVWKNFMEKLISEWVDFILYATVMLAANVGFLAIQPINVQAEVASSISLMFSIGSIISGLLLVRRNRTMAAQNPGTAWKYLDGMKWRYFYLEPLAIVFSLTYALLMWSCVSIPRSSL